MPFSHNQCFLRGKRKFLKIHFSLGESKQRLAQLLPATHSPVPLWAKSEFNSCFPGRLLEVSTLSSWHVPAAKEEEQDEVGRIRALHVPGEPLPVPRLAATQNEKTTSGPKKLNFSANPFLQKCHFDILSWFNTPVFPGEQSFLFSRWFCPRITGSQETPLPPLLWVEWGHGAWVTLLATGKGCPTAEASAEVLGYLNKQLTNGPWN